MTDTSNITCQLESLFSRKFSPISTQLKNIQNRVTTVTDIIVVRPHPPKLQKIEILSKISKSFETMFVKLLENVIKGTRFYKKQYETAQQEYRMVRMMSYHSILQTINCFDQLLKQREPVNYTSVSITIDHLTKQNQKIEKVMQGIQEQLSSVLLNLQQFIAQQSYSMVQELEMRQKFNNLIDYQIDLFNMNEGELLDFLAKNSSDQDILKQVQDKKKRLAASGNLSIKEK